MSLIPFAPFSGDDVGIGEIDAVFEAGFVASANPECLDTAMFTLERSPKSFPCVYRKRLTMHAIERVAEGVDERERR